MSLDMNAELLAAYRLMPLTLRALVRGLDAERARWRPDAESWSVVEVVAHLGDTEERGHTRIRRMLTEDTPLIEGYDEQVLAAEHRYHEQNLDAALERFEQQRDAQVATLEALDAAGWQREGHHNEFGAMTVESLTRLMAFHDAIHLGQIARVLLDQPEA